MAELPPLVAPFRGERYTAKQGLDALIDGRVIGRGGSDYSPAVLLRPGLPLLGIGCVDQGDRRRLRGGRFG